MSDLRCMISDLQMFSDINKSAIRNSFGAQR
jgi:hypothetical protein